MPDGYDFYIYYNGEEFTGGKSGKPLDIYRDREYKNTLLRPYLEKTAGHIEQSEYDIQGCQILLVVKQDIVENPYAYSSLYNQRRQLDYVKWILLGAFIVFILGLGLLVLSVIKRKQIKEFEKVLGKVLGKVFLELKVPVLFMGAIVFLIMVQQFFYMGFPYAALSAVIFLVHIFN